MMNTSPRPRVGGDRHRTIPERPWRWRRRERGERWRCARPAALRALRSCWHVARSPRRVVREANEANPRSLGAPWLAPTTSLPSWTPPATSARGRGRLLADRGGGGAGRKPAARWSQRRSSRRFRSGCGTMRSTRSWAAACRRVMALPGGGRRLLIHRRRSHKPDDRARQARQPRFV
jgi:hypothetical protein